MLGAATSGWAGIGVGMENDLTAIGSRAERHAAEPRYRAEDLIYEAWLGGALSTLDQRDFMTS